MKIRFMKYFGFNNRKKSSLPSSKLETIVSLMTLVEQDENKLLKKVLVKRTESLLFYLNISKWDFDAYNSQYSFKDQISALLFNSISMKSLKKV